MQKITFTSIQVKLLDTQDCIYGIKPFDVRAKISFLDTVSQYMNFITELKVYLLVYFVLFFTFTAVKSIKFNI